MAQTEHMGMDFTEGSVMPMLLRFFLPFLLANLLNSLYNTVDTIIIGQFVGSAGIVAVTMGGKMLNLYTNIGAAFAGGGQVLISQLAGAKRREEFNETIGTLFTEIVVLSLLLAAGTLAASNLILTVLNTPEDAYAPALAYLRITSMGLPLIFGYSAVSSVLRGMGDSKSPLVFIAIAAVVNIIGDIIFIVVFDLGAAGTAIATVMGQGVSLIISLSVLYRRRRAFGFDFRLKSFAVKLDKLKIMFKLGLPTSFRFVFITSTQLYMMSFINLFGMNEAAAYSIGDKVFHMTNVFALSARHAAASMIGQNIGANKHKRVKEIMRCTGLIALTAAAVLSCFALLIPETIFGFFTSEAGVLAYARQFMRIACLIFLASGINAPLEAIVTGTGHAVLSMLGGMMDGVVFRLTFSYLFVWVIQMGVAGFYLADAFARIGLIAVYGSYYFSGAWKKRKRLLD